METAEIACVGSHPCTADERLKVAAKEGDIPALYESLGENPELFKKFEDTHCSFKDTPLHIAAASGHTELVAELMVLQPKMARKLNQDGLSPMHIALKEGHTETVLSMLKIDKDLFSVKGKKGHTTLHYLFTEQNKVEHPLQFLNKYIKKCPQAIFDETNKFETALHLAARKNNHEAFRFLMFWLWSSDNPMNRIKTFLNAKNIDGDTVLHIAAKNSHKEILKLATEDFGINLKTTNLENLTALEIVESKNNECAATLRRAQRKYSFVSPLLFVVEVTNQLAEKARSMPENSTNALLVVTTLILTATYQAALSPPGDVYVPDAQDNSPAGGVTRLREDYFAKPPSAAGSSVLQTGHFLWFFIPNIAAFCMCFMVTCFILISILPTFYSASLVASLSTLLFCLLTSAVIIVSPNSGCLHIMLQYVYILFYVLLFVACIITVTQLCRAIGRPINYRKNLKKDKENIKKDKKNPTSEC